MALSDPIIEGLVAALLAVNSYPVARVQAVVPSLRSALLLQPLDVAAMDIGSITVRLAEAGYDRGYLTGMLAERLQALMTRVATGELDALEDAISHGDEAKFTKLLRTVRGIGPRVAGIAWDLLS